MDIPDFMSRPVWSPRTTWMEFRIHQNVCACGRENLRMDLNFIVVDKWNGIRFGELTTSSSILKWECSGVGMGWDRKEKQHPVPSCVRRLILLPPCFLSFLLLAFTLYFLMFIVEIWRLSGDLAAKAWRAAPGRQGPCWGWSRRICWLSCYLLFYLFLLLCLAFVGYHGAALRRWWPSWIFFFATLFESIILFGF